MKAVASPYHQKLKFPSKEGIMVVREKQDDARHCFRLVVQSTLTEKRPAELAESFHAGGKEDLAKLNEPKEMNKRKGDVANIPESSQLKGKTNWISNPVVVIKRNGKWRVCVNFTDLNRACSKDSFPLPRIDQLVDS